MGAFRRSAAGLWLLLLAVVVIVVLSWPTPASAQCGSSASSCKNCHEVQGAYAVNNSGDWHVSHAFGDFCEFCHAGNVQATEMEAAHVGMAYPLEDVNASCLSCHPNDVMQKAEVYATALGVAVGTGAGGGGADGDTAGGESPPAVVRSEPAVEQTDSPEESGHGEIVDFNSQYARTVLNERPPVNVGNVILTVMSVGLAALGGVLVWKWEGVGDRWQALRAQPGRRDDGTQDGVVISPAQDAAREAQTGDEAPAVQQAPAFAAVLQTLDGPTLQALQRILADAETGQAMIRALAKLDPRLIRIVARLDAEERALLMAVVGTMREESGDGRSPG
jgi:hypothetical protein